MSMRRRLLVWLLSSVLAGGCLAAVVVFFQARAELNQVFDYQLRQLALTLRDRTYSPRQFADALKGEEAIDFVIQVWGQDGTPLYVSHPDLHVPGPVQLGFNDVAGPEGRWRVFVTQQRGLTIQVAQPALVRDQIALAAAWRTLIPFLVALPLMGWLVWRLVGREVRFLESTARAVSKRSPDDAAHELRTPLTALRLQLQLAERARDGAERERAHAALRAGIERAVHLVEQLLALARQDPDAPIEARGTMDLAELARAVVQAHEAAAQHKGLTLSARAGDPVPVAGDRAALRTLAENLVDNAIRYTDAGGITVAAHAKDGEAVFEVEDTGPGIAPAERQRVFDRFYRGETAAQGGTGLGLAIVRRIAERHGGRVELLDAPGGKGLIARVTLSPA